MTETAQARTPLPLEIDRIQSTRSAVGETRLRLSGHWLEPHREHEDEEGLLVVHVEGRRHRFAADGERDNGDSHPGRWSASFTVPSWAEPRQDGQAALWLGSAVIPVPPLHGSAAAPAQSEPEPLLEPEPLPEQEPLREPELPSEPEAGPEPEPASAPTTVAAPAPVAEFPAGPVAEPTPAPDPAPMPASAAVPPPAPHPAPLAEGPRSGPLADLLLKETVSALHAELERRTADAARVRGALASAQSELEARNTLYTELEKTLGELRTELERLREAVEAQRRELQELNAETVALRERVAAAEASAELHSSEATALRAELAAANVSREASASEAAGLRSELERVGSELAVTHERVGSETGDLGEATRLLADARALAAELRTGGVGS